MASATRNPSWNNLRYRERDVDGSVCAVLHGSDHTIDDMKPQTHPGSGTGLEAIDTTLLTAVDLLTDATATRTAGAWIPYLTTSGVKGPNNSPTDSDSWGLVEVGLASDSGQHFKHVFESAAAPDGHAEPIPQLRVEADEPAKVWVEFRDAVKRFVADSETMRMYPQKTLPSTFASLVD
ncbi:hypothetical protein C8Q79DRAFT_922118 [Trametes meyenii]|nr:hypothetical protein C8Q79DRAFT_922118 [Trametes meyenii]